MDKTISVMNKIMKINKRDVVMHKNDLEKIDSVHSKGQ